MIEKVSIDGFSMEYIRFGNGDKTAVILPGLSIQSVLKLHRTVQKEYSLLAEDFTVYLFDRRAELPDRYTVFDMACDTVKVFERLGLKEIYLFGASQGGMIAQEIAAMCPGLVKKLALGSTAAVITDRDFENVNKWIDLARKRDARDLYTEFGRAIYPPEIFEKYKRILAIPANETTENELDRFVILARGIEGFDVRDRLKNISCPVLVLGAGDDGVLPRDAAFVIAEGFSNRDDFELFMYDGYGHAAFDTAPDYRERLKRFFLK